MGRVNPKALLTPTNPYDIKEMPGLASSETPAWGSGFPEGRFSSKETPSQSVSKRKVHLCLHTEVQRASPEAQGVQRTPRSLSLLDLPSSPVHFRSKVAALMPAISPALPDSSHQSGTAPPPEDTSGNLSPSQAPLPLNIDIPSATALSR